MTDAGRAPKKRWRVYFGDDDTHMTPCTSEATAYSAVNHALSRGLAVRVMRWYADGQGWKLFEEFDAS
jgi:hypothetical protein